MATRNPLARASHGRPAQFVQHAQHAQHRTQRMQCRAKPTSAAAAGAELPTAQHSSGSSAPGTTAAVEPAPQVLAGKTVGVAGGGPGGMLCAAHLARLGATVEVFERHDPAVATSDPPAVWSIILSPALKWVIEAAGISADFGPKWRYRLMHTFEAHMHSEHTALSLVFRQRCADSPPSSTGTVLTTSHACMRATLLTHA